MSRARRAGVVAAVGAGAVLVAAGWALLDVSRPPDDVGTLPAASPAAARTTPYSPPVAVAVGGPHRLRAAVSAVAATREGDLALPEDGDHVGWWALGAGPGSGRGTVLLAGHVDTEAGLGAFAELHNLDVGARVEVTGADGRTHPYRITARRTYDRGELPADLFSAHGAPRLALLTCSGDYDPDTGLYAENLVLYAAPVTGT
ncbi:class F sortase [Streptomyces sp. NPDC126499]|uniref:class F sortase n=1 Tax=Streptomyces sp. NPDC126499 TaxID=3155314 RepID=UPI003326554E